MHSFICRSHIFKMDILRPSDVKRSYGHIQKTVADSRQWVELYFGCRAGAAGGGGGGGLQIRALKTSMLRSVCCLTAVSVTRNCTVESCLCISRLFCVRSYDTNSDDTIGRTERVNTDGQLCPQPSECHDP
jgi:hypothetical protein